MPSIENLFNNLYRMLRPAKPLAATTRSATIAALVSGVLVIGAGSATAAAADYFVEAVVFSWSDVNSRGASERWKISGRKPAAMPTAAKSPTDNPGQSSEKRLLDQAISQMVQRGGATTLKHQAWTQLRAGRAGSPQIVFNTSGEKQLSGWIRVYDSTLLYAEIDLALFDENAVSQFAAGAQGGTGRVGADSGIVSDAGQVPGGRTPGVVNRDGVTVTTDANGNVTFSNRAGDDQTEPGQPSPIYEDLSPGETYRIKERRRVKFNEIHYIDHPKFGVLLTITRDEQS